MSIIKEKVVDMFWRKARGLVNRNSLLRNSLLCCLFIISLTKCITPYNPSITTNSEKGLLVVEAYIIAPTGSIIKISRTKNLTSIDNYEKVSNAQITVISDNGDIIATAEEKSAGEYQINNPIEFLAGRKYALNIVIENEHFQSTFEEPLVTPEIDELNWMSKSAGYELDILLSTHDPLQKAEYYLWKYDEDWEYTARLFTEERWDIVRGLVVNTNTDNFYYCWDNSSSNSFILEDVKTLHEGILLDKLIVNLKAGDSRFSYLYSILVKQYAIPYEAYKYYNYLHVNTNETGGLFAPQPIEMEGNITNITNADEPVIGYALITTETSKRIYINGADVPYMKETQPYDCSLAPEDFFASPSVAYVQGWGLYLRLGDGYVYRKLNCVDCRGQGGNKNKPDFWPTAHE